MAIILPRTLVIVALIIGGQPLTAAVTATFLPHGPADPANPAWNNGNVHSYRDIPWWFTDEHSYWADNDLPAGAADAYDISPVWAARLNKNNASGYEAALINTPNYSHLGNINPYGSAGGAFGSPANNITWGKGVAWNFAINYDWNGGNPTASFNLSDGITHHTASAILGTRIIDFVEGDQTRPYINDGLDLPPVPNPYIEPHTLNDVMMRFATIGTNNPDQFTMTSVTVSDMSVSINGGTPEAINYFDGSALQTSLTTRWDYIPGEDTTTNPRQIQFLVFDNLLPGHESTFELTGTLIFDWEGNANSISSSGLMFEAKLGDLDFFPDAAAQIPEPSAALLAIIGFTIAMRRRRI